MRRSKCLHCEWQSWSWFLFYFLVGKLYKALFLLHRISIILITMCLQINTFPVCHLICSSSNFCTEIYNSKKVSDSSTGIFVYFLYPFSLDCAGNLMLYFSQVLVIQHRCFFCILLGLNEKKWCKQGSFACQLLWPKFGACNRCDLPLQGSCQKLFPITTGS